MKTLQILSIVLLAVLAACTNSPVEDFVVGDNFIKDQAGVVMIDTLTIKSSTVKFDSLISNSSGRLLVGCNYNSFSGYMNSNAYLELKFDGTMNYTTFVFDSLCMILNYDTYYSGDTAVPQTFNIYQLSEQMALNNSNLYTTSHFDNLEIPLATVTLKPHPKSHKALSIRLADVLGKRLSQMIKDKSDTISTQSLFQKFFNGIVIQSQSNVKGAVIGLSVASSTSTGSDASSGSSTTTATASTKATMPEIRLYFHLSPNPTDLKDLYYKFSFITDGIYFNQIAGNSSNSLIDGISESGDERDSKLTGNDVLVQSGIQTFAKIKIPYVDNLLWMGKNSGLIGATLKLYPVKGTYNNAANLPDSLYIFSADRKNQLSSQVTLPGSTNYVYAALKIQKDVEETVYYEADVSSFVDTELQEYLETNRSLMIGYGSTLAKKTAEHVILGGSNSGKFAPDLNVYYYHN